MKIMYWEWKIVWKPKVKIALVNSITNEVLWYGKFIKNKDNDRWKWQFDVDVKVPTWTTVYIRQEWESNLDIKK